MKDLKNPSFDVKDLLPIGFTLIVLGLGIAYGLDIMTDTYSDMEVDACTDTVDNGGVDCSWNSTGKFCVNSSGAGVGFTRTPDSVAVNNTISAVAEIPDKLDTVIVVIMAAVIIGVLVTYLYQRFAK